MAKRANGSANVFPILPFYDFASGRGRGPQPIAIETDIDMDVVHACQRGERDYPREVTARVTNWKRWEDMPFPLGVADIVSERLLRILQAAQPGEVISVPIRLEPVSAKADRDAPKYYLVDTRLRVDCADLKRSVPEREPTNRSYKYFYLDPSRVPSDCHFFRPAPCGHLVISHHIREQAERLGITGPQYHSPDLGVLEW